MKRESSWGLAAFVAVAATIGIAVQPWSQGAGSAGQSTNNATTLAPQQVAESASFSEACSGLAGLLAEFVATDKASVGGPDVCYKPGKRDFSAKPKPVIPFDIKFVIATVPDPVHTHLSLIFDRFTEAIKEAAQDEHYLFESSWMPWDDDKPTYALLKDQDDADSRKSEREKQPGLILFRGTPRDEKERSAGLAKMLAVFIVGEESTAGIHREQFRNASAWVAYLSRRNKDGAPRVAILGPSFTGSFSSLDQLISDSEIGNRLLSIESEKPSNELSIYSGSANGGNAIKEFKDDHNGKFAKVHKFSVEFHSFLGSDDNLVQNFLHYIGADPGRASASRIAIISEEDTAFGMSPPSSKEEGKGEARKGLNLEKNCRPQGRCG